jgi:tripartite-type tricarboxylate transporter receptor subunit TctC
MKYLKHLVAAVLVAAILAPVTSFAQAWPSRPIRLVVGFPPGGGIDFFARALANKLQEQLGQTVLVENRPGANGMIGGDMVAKAAPDGYTILVSNEAQIVVNQFLYTKVPYDPLKDLEPVSLAVTAPVILYVHPALGANSVPEVLALARAKPGQLAYASVGTGTVHHLSAELLKSAAHIDFLHVPYKGGGPAAIAMVAGDVPIGFAGYSALAHARAGKLKALATTGAKRSQATPELPTFLELGFPDMRLVGWHGLLVPAHTPRTIIDRLSAEVNKAIHSPDLQPRLVQQGFDVVGNTPEEFSRLIQSEVSVYARVVKASGAKLD